MKFSFVLPAFKGRYLRDSINSILHQTYENFELIIVDDCSPDNLKGIVESFSDSRIAYYRNQENIGGCDLVAQWNHCLSYAKGDYLILATDDDLYEPNFLSSFVPLIDKYPKVDLFRARILQVDSNNIIKHIDRCYKEFMTELEFRYYMMHGIRGGIPHYIFKRDTLLQNGGFVNFPLGWGADDATAMMLSRQGVVNSQEHLVRFRYSDINISSDQKHTGIQKLQARLALIKWLKEHNVVIPDKNDWSVFYHREVLDYLPIYIKQILIIRLSSIPFCQWPKALRLIFKSHQISLADKYSIVYHSVMSKN